MNNTRSERGAALILTLVAIAITATLLAGIGTLVLGHYARARTDQDAAKSLQYAESALNFQIQKISASLTITGNVPGSIYGTSENAPYSLYADNTVSNLLPKVTTADTCVCWVNGTFNAAAQQDVYGKATLNGATRYVHAKAGAHGIFDTWAIFSATGLALNGNLKVLPYTGTTSGVVGSNGPIQTDNNQSNQVGGYYLYGSGATINHPEYTNINYEPQKVDLTPIYSIANQVANRLKTGTGTLPAYASGIPTTTGIKNFASSNDNSLATGIPANKNIGNNGSATLLGKVYGSNYYINRVDGNNISIVANVTNGPVNLWIDHTDSQNNKLDDVINGSINITVTDANNTGTSDTDIAARAAKFHVYYSNFYGHLKFGGNGIFDGMLYAYDRFTSAGVETGAAPNGTTVVERGSVDPSGTPVIHGSVMAYFVGRAGGNNTINGNVTIYWPSDPGVQAGEGYLFYGIVTPWQEYLPVRGNS